MGHSNGVITAPVNTDDISTVLGVASHDVKTLCDHERVKKWSVKKPTDDGTALTDTPAALSDADYEAANYGLIPPTVVGSPDLATTLWAYRARRWGRLTDFDGYNDRSGPPYTGEGDADIYRDELSWTFTGNRLAPPTANGITPGKMPSLKNMYFGVGLKAPNGTVYIKTCTSPLSSLSALEITKAELPVQTVGTQYTYYLVASTNAVANLVTASSAKSTYRMLPADELLTGTLTLVNKYCQDFTATRVGVMVSAPSASGSLTVIGRPLPPGTAEPTIVSTGGAIGIALDITNTGRDTVVLNKTSFTAKIMNSLSQTTSNTESIGVSPSQIWTATWAEPTTYPDGAWKPLAYGSGVNATTSGVSIAPGESKQVIVYFSQLLFINNSNTITNPGNTQVTKQVSINLYYSNNSIASVKGTVTFKASNK